MKLTGGIATNVTQLSLLIPLDEQTGPEDFEILDHKGSGQGPIAPKNP